MASKNGFRRYELDERVLATLPELGFRRPTEVQEKVIPLFLQKRNLIVEAPTGTGKTAAYGFPLISMLDLMKKKTQAMVLVPSRELALQVSSALVSYYEGKKLKVAAVFGGVPIDESYQAIKSGPHILVAVPGRLKDVMAHYQYDYLWRDIKFLIVDEADKMLESGFQKDFDDIREHIRKRAQVGFFSATISTDSEQLIRERVSRAKTIRLEPKQILRNIRFQYIQVPKGKRETYLAALLKQQNVAQALIFCSRRQDIYAVTGFLRNMGLKSEAYYGNQEQRERANILNRFKEGHIDYLVASDLAARGLDIPDLPAVINLAIPQEYDFYLHRIGRTGRAGNKGKVYNLLTSKAEVVRMKRHHKDIGLPVKSFELEAPQQALKADQKVDKWIKFHLSRGKRDKIRKGDVVGFLVNEAKLDADEIGTITIYESYSIVDLPQKVLDTLSSKADLKIKGKTVKVRKFLLEEQQRKAQSVKRLKQDRR